MIRFTLLMLALIAGLAFSQSPDDLWEKTMKGEPPCGPPKQIYIDKSLDLPSSNELTAWVESYQVECQSRQVCLMGLYVMSNGHVWAQCGEPTQTMWTDGFVKYMTWYNEI